MRTLSAAFALLLFRPVPLVAQQPEVHTRPDTLVNGTAFVVRVTPPEKWQRLDGLFGGHTVFFDEDASGTWTGLAGVPLEAPAGTHELLLHATSASGSEVKTPVSLNIQRLERPTSELHVAAKFVEPSPAARERIKREQALKARVFATLTPDSLLTAGFAAPVVSSTSEGFGVQRVFNGEKQSVHLGLDYRAATGTPIRAVNSGRVILARELYFEGRCVAVDHGRGLITLYLHFSRIAVKEGQMVRRGQKLGDSGATGRVSGPHLHLAARWQGVYLDPASILALDLR